MSGNLENERSVTAGKMYPMDLAPQKITIVKSMPSSEVKMAHLIPGQTKTSASGQIITNAGSLSLMRPTAQIISQGVASQPQMIVSGAPILQGAQIVSQSSQLLGQNSQIITQTSQIIGPSGQVISPATQIISQGSQLIGQSAQGGNMGPAMSVTPAISSGGTQVLSVSGQLVGSSGGVVVGAGIRALAPAVRVFPPLQHHSSRPVLSSVSVGPIGGVVTSKVGVSSHVPRGPAAGASLAVPRALARPSTPTPLSVSSIGGTWGGTARGSVRGALVYSARAAVPRTSAPRLAAPMGPATTPSLLTQSTTTILNTGGVISSATRGPNPRVAVPVSTLGPRPLPLLQRNYQPTKVLGLATVRAPSAGAPSTLYYEVARPPAPHSAPPAPLQQALPVQTTHVPRSNVSYNHGAQSVGAGGPLCSIATSVPTTTTLARPSILRKREVEGSPSKNSSCVVGIGILESRPLEETSPAWERDGSEAGGEGGGSTTVSAASSPAPDDEPPSPPRAPTPPLDISPRKKPRKQMLSSEVRHCEYQSEDTPASPPAPPPVHPPPRRSLLGAGWVCGWRATAHHFVRPTDVRRRDPPPRDVVSLANQKNVLNSAEGWKVHHLTAQMDDLVTLEGGVCDQLGGVLRSLEASHGRAHTALAPHMHALLELVKGNMQRSRIVCEGIQEARADILRVFTHRALVADILARQADKRCFRKHRSQS